MADLVDAGPRLGHRLVRRARDQHRPHAAQPEPARDRPGRRAPTLWLIDHGAALYVHHDWPAATPERARAPFVAIKDHVLLPLATEIAAADARLAPRLTPDVLAAVLAAVPDALLMDAPAGRAPAFATPDANRQAYLDLLTARLEAPRAWVAAAIEAREAVLAAPAPAARLPPMSALEPAVHAYDYAVVRVVPRVETGDGEAVGVALHARRAGVFALVLAATPDALGARLAARWPGLDADLTARALRGMAEVAAGRGGPLGLLPPSERFHWLVAVALVRPAGRARPHRSLGRPGRGGAAHRLGHFRGVGPGRAARRLAGSPSRPAG